MTTELDTGAQAPEATTPSPGTRLPVPSLFAFVGSGSLLVLELVAGRILAPVVGVSLYTWTSIIGVVLAGISLGNWIGGRIADRKPTAATLSAVYTFAALSSALILALARDPEKFTAPHAWPAILQVVWIAALMFFVPATLLGMPTPIIVKLTLASLGSTGRVVGRVQAAATLGAIVGTFATGFFLISAFGTRTIVAAVSVVLFLLALASNPVWNRRRAMEATLILLFVAGMLGLSKSACTVESNYYCISIEQTEPGVLAMRLDFLLHGFVDTKDPAHVLYSYERLYEEILDESHPRGTRVDGLLLGGGTYTFPRWLEKHHTGRIVVAEIDPAVTQAARDHLFFRPGPRMEIAHDDARRVVEALGPADSFDVVLGDTFNDLSVPYHLTTLEFDRLIARHLRDDGLYLVNVVDGVRHEFLRSYMRTLKEVFPYVGLMAEPNAWPPRTLRKTFVVVAGRQFPPNVPSLIPQAEVDRFLRDGHSTLLTDDYVPVDQLLTPLFRQRLES